MNNCCAKIQALLHKTSHNLVNILHNKPDWLSGLVEWHWGKWYPWCRRKWQAMSSFVTSSCELSWVLEMPVSSKPYFTQVILIISDETMFSNSLNKCKFFDLNFNYTCTNETHTCLLTHVHARAHAHARTHTHTHTQNPWASFFPPCNSAAITACICQNMHQLGLITIRSTEVQQTEGKIIHGTTTAWWYYVKLSNSEFHNYHFSNSQVFTDIEMSRWMIRKILISNWKYIRILLTINIVIILCILIFGF